MAESHSWGPLRSDQVTKGVARAPHRSLLKADGITDEEMGRPFVAVISSRNDIIPGHTNLDKISEAVKAGIYLAGGVPFEISTVGEIGRASCRERVLPPV